MKPPAGLALGLALAVCAGPSALTGSDEGDADLDRGDHGRRAAMHAVWSAALDRPTLSEMLAPLREGAFDGLLLVAATAHAGQGSREEIQAGLRRGLMFPPEHRADLEEIIEDAVRSRGRSVKLDPALLETSTPYQLVSANDYLEATSLMNKSVVKVFNPENRRRAEQADHAIRMGYVNFNRDRTIAILSYSVFCPGFCAESMTRVLIRSAEGHWEDRVRWRGASELS